MSTDYSWSTLTPVDNTGSQYSIFRSPYKNIRFALPVNSKYTVTESDIANLAGIAKRLFGDSSYWRIILHFNGLTDPISDIYPGRVLNIPSKSAVIDFLSQQQTEQLSTLTI